MTPIDRFERQLPAALSDLAQPRTPDYFLDILGQTARTRQRPAWVSIERWFPMDTPTTWSRRGLPARMAIVGVVIALLLVVGAVILSGGGPKPAPGPIASAAVVAPAAPSATPSPGPVPAAVKGGWTSTSRGTPREDGLITTINLGGSSMDRFAPEFSIDRPGKTRELGSNVMEVSPGVLRFYLSNPGDSGCKTRDAGDYRYAVSSDGQWLTLTSIDDQCAVRGEILPGTWQRNLGFNNPGGPGVAVNFYPYLGLTLPATAWTGREFAEADTLVADREDATFKVWRNLDGFADPCDITKGRVTLKDLDAFIAYFEDDPRFTVSSKQEFTMDGHPAVQIEFQLGKDLKAPCWTFDGNKDDPTGVLLWRPHAIPDGFWNGQIDTPGFIVATQVGNDVIAFEAGKMVGKDWVVDRETLDTVRFLDALPAPPAS